MFPGGGTWGTENGHPAYHGNGYAAAPVAVGNGEASVAGGVQAAGVSRPAHDPAAPPPTSGYPAPSQPPAQMPQGYPPSQPAQAPHSQPQAPQHHPAPPPANGYAAPSNPAAPHPSEPQQAFSAPQQTGAPAANGYPHSTAVPAAGANPATAHPSSPWGYPPPHAPSHPEQAPQAKTNGHAAVPPPRDHTAQSAPSTSMPESNGFSAPSASSNGYPTPSQSAPNSVSGYAEHPQPAPPAQMPQGYPPSQPAQAPHSHPQAQHHPAPPPANGYAAPSQPAARPSEPQQAFSAPQQTGAPAANGYPHSTAVPAAGANPATAHPSSPWGYPPPHAPSQQEQAPAQTHGYPPHQAPAPLGHPTVPPPRDHTAQSAPSAGMPESNGFSAPSASSNGYPASSQAAPPPTSGYPAPSQPPAQMPPGYPPSQPAQAPHSQPQAPQHHPAPPPANGYAAPSNPAAPHPSEPQQAFSAPQQTGAPAANGYPHSQAVPAAGANPATAHPSSPWGYAPSQQEQAPAQTHGYPPHQAPAPSGQYPNFLPQQQGAHSYLPQAMPYTPPVVHVVEDDTSYNFRDKLHGKLRGYQREMFDKCLDQNSIAVMPTGTGKTLLAMCLCEHTRVKTLRESGRKKPALFLFKTRSLCIQQHRRCREQYSSIGKARVERKIVSLIEDPDALSHTPEDIEYAFSLAAPFLNSYLQVGDQNKIANFSCIVFDECHNVRGASPMANILKQYLHTIPAAEQPFVLGLTATPFTKRQRHEVEMDELCAVLDARIVTPLLPESLAEMETYASQAPPEVTTVAPTLLEGMLNGLIIKALRDICAQLRHFKNSPLYDHSLTVDEILEALQHEEELKLDMSRSLENAVGAELPLKTMCKLNRTLLDMQNVAHKCGVASAKELFDERYEKDFCNVFVTHGYVPESVSPAHKDAFLHEAHLLFGCLRGVCDGLNTIFSQLGAADHMGSKERAVLSEISKEHATRGDDMRVLIFVSEIVEAKSMAKRFTTLLKNPHNAPLRVECYTSETQKGKGETILRRFLEGSLKVIFSTTALEEGIDIPACSLVIRFFMNSFSIVDLNQCRGRARRSGARFVLFVANEDELQQAHRHLDYSVVMSHAHDHSLKKRGVEREGVCIYDDRNNAERLVHAHCIAMIRGGYASSKDIPIIYTCVTQEGRTLVMKVPLPGVPEGRPFSIASNAAKTEGNAKFDLMRSICQYLASIKQLHVPTSFDPKAVFAMRDFDTTHTGCGKALTVNKHSNFSQQNKENNMQKEYVEGEWRSATKPYDKLAELCQNHELNFQHRQVGAAHYVRITLQGKGKSVPLVFEATGLSRAGFGDRNCALQNSSLMALCEAFGFSFFNEEAPKEIIDRVPTVAERQRLKVVNNYNYREGREAQVLVRQYGPSYAPLPATANTQHAVATWGQQR